MCFSFTVFNRIIGMVYAHFFFVHFTTNLDLVYFWFCVMCVDYCLMRVSFLFWLLCSGGQSSIGEKHGRTWFGHDG